MKLPRIFTITIKKIYSCFKELGLKAFRFSIAWTRIMDIENNKTNQKGISFYHQVIDECLNQGIEPIVTMYHFDLPYFLEEQGRLVKSSNYRLFCGTMYRYCLLSMVTR